MNKLLVLFIVFLSFSTLAFSQRSVWLGLGLTTSTKDLSSTLDFNFQLSERYYLSAILNSNQKITPPDSDGYIKSHSYGIGGGLLFKNKKPFLLTISSGILASQSYYDTNQIRSGVGFPVKVQGFITTKVIGIGLYAMYQIDTVRDFGGVGLIIGLGVMR